MIYKVTLPFGIGFATNLENKLKGDKPFKLVDGRYICKEQILSYRPLENAEMVLTALPKDKVPNLDGTVAYYIYTFKISDMWLRVKYNPHTREIFFPYSSVSGSTAWNIANINTIHNLLDIEEYESVIKLAVLNYLRGIVR